MNKIVFKIKKTDEPLSASALKLWKSIKKHWLLLLMFLPPLIYFIIFKYGPMYGVLIAFKDYKFSKGVWGSPWVGFKYFKTFLTDQYFYKLLRNTLAISIYNIIAGFPAPIILALLLNELRNQKYKKIVQTVSYLPHFLSTVIVCGIVISFCASDGFIANILSSFGYERLNYLMYPKYFRHIYVWSGVWQSVGWDSIIYLAALSGVDPQLYEAAKMDGAGRFRQAIHVTLPGIANTIIIMIIMRIGSLISVGFEKIIVLYNEAVYETADVISTYVYRRGLIGADYSYATAVGIFESVIGIILITIANSIARKYSETSLF